MRKDKIKIYIAYHKDSYIVENDIFVPVQVGRSTSDISLKMIGDDTGENISFKNNVYCELTATYWAWKNNHDSDYIGICHYRRFFTFKKPLFVFAKYQLRKMQHYLKFLLGDRSDFLNWNHVCVASEDQLLTNIIRFSKQIYDEIDTGKYNIYALRPVKIFHKSIWDIQVRPSGEYSINILEEIINELHPEYSTYLKETLHGGIMYHANMVIMKNDLFNEYAKFLFSVLERHEKKVIIDRWCFDPISEKSYNRLAGYLGEILTSVFILRYMRNNPAKVKLLYQLRLIN